MSAFTTAMTSSPGMTSSSVYTTSAFWERLWRTAGIQSVLCFLVAYIAYGHQPQVGASADALAAFYDGGRLRILIAAVFYGLAILNLMWFAAAIRTTLEDAGQDGWGGAATASSAALGALFLLLTGLVAGLAYSIRPVVPAGALGELRFDAKKVDIIPEYPY
jgi:succinate dehydrogenase/fumarate reductase cytochrome b subunit